MSGVVEEVVKEPPVEEEHEEVSKVPLCRVVLPGAVLPVPKATERGRETLFVFH